MHNYLYNNFAVYWLMGAYETHSIARKLLDVYSSHIKRAQRLNIRAN